MFRIVLETKEQPSQELIDELTALATKHGVSVHGPISTTQKNCCRWYTALGYVHCQKCGAKL